MNRLAMLMLLSAALCGAGPLHSDALAQPAPAQAAPPRNVAEYDLPKSTKLAIEGYDPVAYFPEHGGKALKGKADFETEHMGVKYRFASAANRDAFLQSPSQFEPAYGGWCAWAMKDGEKTSIDPKTFIVRDGRLFLFYNGFGGNTKSQWEKQDHAAQTRQSDDAWKRLSGEEPRIPPAPAP